MDAHSNMAFPFLSTAAPSKGETLQGLLHEKERLVDLARQSSADKTSGAGNLARNQHGLSRDTSLNSLDTAVIPDCPGQESSKGNRHKPFGHRLLPFRRPKAATDIADDPLVGYVHPNIRGYQDAPMFAVWKESSFASPGAETVDRTATLIPMPTFPATELFRTCATILATPLGYHFAMDPTKLNTSRLLFSPLRRGKCEDLAETVIVLDIGGEEQEFHRVLTPGGCLEYIYFESELSNAGPLTAELEYYLFEGWLLESPTDTRDQKATAERHICRV
ncbi:verprolin [Purpureocillium lavendulum]|uniref:Verprolin n=1 Tax=Purpureocillium lavendulum TaxID=1247861 RepID=A0AB34FNU6_9HYPO|nr:verprolin [Purpureocillium lavendulum]